MPNLIQPQTLTVVLWLCISGCNMATHAQSGNSESPGNELEDSLIIEDESDELLESDTGDLLIIDDDETPADNTDYSSSTAGIAINLDQVWLEYGYFNRDSDADYQLFGNLEASLNWQAGHWEAEAGIRLETYYEHPSDDNIQPKRGDWDDTRVDYGDTFVRYKGRHDVVTVGAQTIIWGRIDEFPPSDRLSTQDLRRGILDDLEERRLPSLALRYEHFFRNSQLDVFYLPKFRETELPGQHSVWYPINQQQGTILGLDTNSMVEHVVRTTPVREDEPENDGGAGLRFSQLGNNLDFAVGVSRGIATLPYFAYNPVSNQIRAHYLRSTTLFGDLGFEALGGTVKFEAAWNSDSPVTRSDGRFTSVESLAWGIAFELFPGDADTRINLQLIGNHLLDNPSVLDRDNALAFNGSLESPFGDNNWRARLRFNIGLDMHDLYLNPELTYTGIRNQEVYLETHVFDGAKGSVGGFFEDNSLLTVGWRLNL